MLKYSSFHGSMWSERIFWLILGTAAAPCEGSPIAMNHFQHRHNLCLKCPESRCGQGYEGFSTLFCSEITSKCDPWMKFFFVANLFYTHHDFPLSRCSVTWKIVAANSRDLIWRYRKAGLFTNGSWTGRACRATGFWYKMFRCLLFKTNTKRVTDKTQQSMYFWLNMVCFSLL